jgi:hypothetical protein
MITLGLIFYMMKNSKMSLDAFKANAKNESVELALESVQGGGLFNCHGKSGQAGKAIGGWITDRVDGWLNGPNGPTLP